MVNSKRGEVAITIGGEEHVLRFSLGALREIQEHFGTKGLQETFENAENWGAADLVVLFMAGLKRGSMPDVTKEALEELLVMQEIPEYMEALTKGMNVGTAGKTKVDPTRPKLATAPKPQVSTGTS